MANNIKDINYFDLFFADLVQNILGVTQDKVRISYSEYGQVSFKFDDNICFVHASFEDDYVSKYRDRKNKYLKDEDVFIHSQETMRVIRLKIVFYGDKSSINSFLVSESLHLENTLQELKKEDLSIIGEKTKIIKTHELINSRWWERTDLDLYFYNSVLVEENVNPVDEVNIVIADENIKEIID